MLPVSATSTFGTLRAEDGQMDDKTEGQTGRKCDRWTYKPKDRHMDKIDGKT